MHTIFLKFSRGLSFLNFQTAQRTLSFFLKRFLFTINENLIYPTKGEEKKKSYKTDPTFLVLVLVRSSKVVVDYSKDTLYNYNLNQ